MSTLFTTDDYATLAAIVFREDYPGNATARGIIEAPNGDGAQDTTKRYAHVATKYLDNLPYNGAGRSKLAYYLTRAFEHAFALAAALDVPEAFMPSFEAGALRVLEYPPGADSAPHTDVGLLTLNLYRDQPACLETHTPEAGWAGVPGAAPPPYHLGRIAREIGLGPAAPHRVVASATTQHSIVYFAVPDHEAILPGGRGRLGTWLDAEMAKMRSTKKNDQY